MAGDDTGRRQRNESQNQSADTAHDYDEGGDQLWRAYVSEAESHDSALVETWKDDMESIIIFVRDIVCYLWSDLTDSATPRPVFTQLA